jgi:stage II sporulation protein AB (anti-sigma F factor)
VVELRESLRRIYPASAEAVTAARADLSGFAEQIGASPTTTEAVRLCVSEAVTNAVLHGYPGRPGEPIEISAAITGRDLWVLVGDRGRGHQAPPVRPGLGWGLALITDATDELVIAERAGGGTELRMRFTL